MTKMRAVVPEVALDQAEWEKERKKLLLEYGWIGLALDCGGPGVDTFEEMRFGYEMGFRRGWLEAEREAECRAEMNEIEAEEAEYEKSRQTETA